MPRPLPTIARLVGRKFWISGSVLLISDATVVREGFRMPRRYKPIELQLKPVTGTLAAAEARCPRCEAVAGTVLGRLGLRLVFRCEICKVRFYRHPQLQTMSG